MTNSASKSFPSSCKIILVSVAAGAVGAARTLSTGGGWGWKVPLIAANGLLSLVGLVFFSAWTAEWVRHRND